MGLRFSNSMDKNIGLESLEKENLEWNKMMEEKIKKRNQYSEDVNMGKIIPPEGKENFLEQERLRKLESERLSKVVDSYLEERKKEKISNVEDFLLPEYKDDGFFNCKEFLTIEEIVDRKIEIMKIDDIHGVWYFKKKLLKEEYNIDWKNPEERYGNGIIVHYDSFNSK